MIECFFVGKSVFLPREKTPLRYVKEKNIRYFESVERDTKP